MNVPTCRNCRVALDNGPHLHDNQCVKALRHLREALEQTVLHMALTARDLRGELNHTRNILAQAALKAGGTIAIPDAGVVPVPEDHYIDLSLKRNEAKDGLNIVATIVKEEPATTPASQAPATA